MVRAPFLGPTQVVSVSDTTTICLQMSLLGITDVRKQPVSGFPTNLQLRCVRI